jgi:small subunit ribosomal protein S9
MADATSDFVATGRRKTAVARVRMAPGTGKFTVNGRELDNYFKTDEYRSLALQPLVVTENTEKFDIRVNVTGGGPCGQAGATRHGVRALIKADAEYRAPLKAEGLLTRDPRMKERKKPGQPKARKHFQFSKR